MTLGPIALYDRRSSHKRPAAILCAHTSRHNDFYPKQELQIRLIFERLGDKGYVATSPDVPGLVAQGRTVLESTEIARDVARKIAESCLEHGDLLPVALESDMNS